MLLLLQKSRFISDTITTIAGHVAMLQSLHWQFLIVISGSVSNEMLSCFMSTL